MKEDGTIWEHHFRCLLVHCTKVQGLISTSIKLEGVYIFGIQIRVSIKLRHLKLWYYNREKELWPFSVKITLEPF